MYHSISDEQENGHPYFWINTSPARFAEHMKYLHDNNYKVISLSEAVKLISNESNVCSNIPAFHHSISPESEKGESIGPPIIPSFHHSTIPQDKYVVLTFDDGYRNFFTKAVPILQQYEFRGTMYLPTNFIGTNSLNGGKRLDWNEVRELRDIGIEIGSHTVNHLQLKMSKREEIEYEIRGSKEKIEENLGETIESFSYPFAFPEADKKLKNYLRTIMKASGYKTGVTTIIGLAAEADAPFFLKRLPINSRDDLLFLRAKLEGGYDWMHSVQYAKKIMMEKLKNGLDKLSLP
jgi:peptidoglycan/xylan/chitin deacetylase (PgdA/CDA1 family)